MSQITYQNKTALVENADIPVTGKVTDDDMNEIKQVVNANETKILLAVTDTAPSECSTGDMYFNTSTNLIYTATGTDTWGSTGVAPTLNTIYLELTNQTAYAYNGTTLVSVGGGSGSQIVIDPDEPTEDTKLYIESMDLDVNSGTEITNQYSESTTLGYSCDYTNEHLKGTEIWVNSNPGSHFAGQDIPITGDYEYFEIQALYGPSSNFILTTKLFKNKETNITYSYFYSGTLYVRRRRFSHTTNKIVIYNADLNESANNGIIIPYKIIGYK